MSTARDTILSRVQSALAKLPQRAPMPAWTDQVLAARTAATGRDLWPLFAERLSGVHGTPLADVSALRAFLAGHGCTQGYCDPRLIDQVRAAIDPSVVLSATFERSRFDEYQFGITLADGAIAETGTVILTDTNTPNRLAALAPWIHVAVVKASTLHPDLPAAVAAMPKDPNVIWVTGPSKTADVEGILIEGVHGPGIQAALLLE